MKILTISGSLRAASHNNALIRALKIMTAPESTFDIYEAMGELPHFNPDLDTDDPPTSVRELRERLAWADALIICTPEYAHGMPGSLKNLLDWTVSSADFDHKPVAAISASPSVEGGARAHTALVQTLRVLGATLPEGALLIVPLVAKRVDRSGVIHDPALESELRRVLTALQVAYESPL